MEMALVFDPLITVTNYKLLGAEYRYLMQECARVDTGYQMPANAVRLQMIMPGVRALFNRLTVRNIDEANSQVFNA
jgi:hypothetical protein